jgi:glutamate synthase (NADPH/NADH) small chain
MVVPVTIGAIEKYITDTAFEMGWVQPAKPRREAVATV